MFGLVCQSLSGFLSSFRCVMAGSFFQEATILESHGIDVQSPGGHSNSDDIDSNDYTEQVRTFLNHSTQYSVAEYLVDPEIKLTCTAFPR